MRNLGCLKTKKPIFFSFFLATVNFFFFVNFMKLKVIWVLLLDLKLDTACKFKAVTQIFTSLRPEKII